MRERLPDERVGHTHHFVIHYAKTVPDGSEGTTELDEIDGYLTMNTYPDGRLGEVFVRISKMGDEISGMLDGFATIFSMSLQSGANLRKLVDKMIATRFKPFGPTNNPDIPKCTSILDYIGHYLKKKFLAAPRTEDEARRAQLQAVVRELEAALGELKIANVDSGGLEEAIARVKKQVDPQLSIVGVSA